PGGVMTTTAVDPNAVETFVEKAMSDLAGATATILAVLGDRLELFRSLAEQPATSVELAERAGIDERYAREWLAAMTAAGYVEHEAATGSFALPPAQQAVLADDGGPMSMGGFYQSFAGEIGVLDRLTDAFRNGGGVPQSAYSDDFWAGAERLTAAW